METSKYWISNSKFIILLIIILGGFYIFDQRLLRQEHLNVRFFEMHGEILKEIADIYKNKG